MCRPSCRTMTVSWLTFHAVRVQFFRGRRPVIRVAVVDDHPHVAIALRALLDKTPDIQLVAESRRGSDVTTLMRQARPDVLLLDVFIEPEFEGLSGVDQLRPHFPKLRDSL